MSAPLTHRQRMRRNRVLKARRALQELRTLKREGVLYARNTIEPITLEQWRAELREQVHRRITTADPGAVNPIERKIQAHDRAHDIARRGTASSWYKVLETPGPDPMGDIAARLARIIARGVNPPGFTDEELKGWRFWAIANPWARARRLQAQTAARAGQG